ncbi:MAG: NfeD family protein, partial [Alphaproteobacteria bacterium]
MLQDLFDQLGPWTWIIVGLILLALEIFVSLPGSLFLFTGVAALIVGASALVFDWAWQFQLFGFA